MTAKKSGASSAKNDVSIGIILFDSESEYFDEITSGMNDAAEAYSSQKPNIITKGIEYSIKAQLLAIDELVKMHIKGLIITPMDVPEVRSKLAEVMQKGIEVVTVNSDIEDTDRMCYVGPDAYKSGTVAGGLMKILTGDSAEIAIITGSSELHGHRERVRGFTETVTKKPSNITIDAVSDCKDDSY
ncbi:MAG: substrate-binding domain-containing protein, partial [Lachnospiraceae bacterium]|nr:substrate-binding domain-containing protein [Lachnospiraceae bacterium]